MTLATLDLNTLDTVTGGAAGDADDPKVKGALQQIRQSAFDACTAKPNSSAIGCAVHAVGVENSARDGMGLARQGMIPVVKAEASAWAHWTDLVQ